MKQVLLVLLLAMMILSCHSYKTIGFSEFRDGRRYEVELNNGQTLDARYKSTKEDSVYLLINNSVVEFPKSKIVRIRRKKVSAIVLIGGCALATVGIVAFINYADKDGQFWILYVKRPINSGFCFDRNYHII